MLLWDKGDYDQAFFVTVAQLLPCVSHMSANAWSMIVFWNERGTEEVPSGGPDVGLDFTDQPVPEDPHPGDQGPPPSPMDEDNEDMPGSGPISPEPDEPDSGSPPVRTDRSGTRECLGP